MDSQPTPYPPFHDPTHPSYLPLRIPPTFYEGPLDVLGRVLGDRAEEDPRENIHSSDEGEVQLPDGRPFAASGKHVLLGPGQTAPVAR